MKPSLIAVSLLVVLTAPACSDRHQAGVTRASTACPSKNFEEFLKAFANDRRLQARYVAPQVKTTNVDLDVGEDYVSRMVSREEFLKRREFEITYRDGNFHPSRVIRRVEPGVELHQVRLEELPDGSYLAGVPENIEGYDFKFEWRNDCWLLTEGPGLLKE